MIDQFLMEESAGVLKSPVAMEDWMGIRIHHYRFFKSLMDQRIIVAVTDHIGNDLV